MQQWFKDAKFGISLHWGIYAVNGIPESWSFFNGSISYEDYMKQCDGFTASRYDPEAWADLFARAGAQYAVLTTKHHDGVALWDTAVSDLSVVKKTPAARDLVQPYCDAMRKKGLKVGFYFSHLDWSHPDYPTMYSPLHLQKMALGTFVHSPYVHPADGKLRPERWESFLAFHRAQLTELMTRYGTIDMFCFDGDWERSSEQWRMAELRDLLHELNPNVVLNSRMCGLGDFETPEQGIPIAPPKGEWEFWFTVNDSWGYQPQDQNYKSVRQIIRMFADCIGMGGNVLLNVAPLEDGTIDPVQEDRLLQLGEWLEPNGEAVYGTMAGLPAGHYNGASTLSKDRTVLYLFYYDKPLEALPVKGLFNAVKSVNILKSGKELGFRKIGGAPWLNVPGILWIDLPEEYADERATVIRVELEGELKLYTGSGKAIDVN
nr:alpha-L-fucosidase [Paenibacillus antri]